MDALLNLKLDIKINISTQMISNGTLSKIWKSFSSICWMKVLMWPAVAADALTLVLSGIYPGTGQVVQSSVKVRGSEDAQWPWQHLFRFNGQFHFYSLAFGLVINVMWCGWATRPLPTRDSHGSSGQQTCLLFKTPGVYLPTIHHHHPQHYIIWGSLFIAHATEVTDHKLPPCKTVSGALIRLPAG